MTTNWVDQLTANCLSARFGEDGAMEIAVRELNRCNAADDAEGARAWGGVVAVFLYDQTDRWAA